MRVAIYPGTFDPVTNGHLDILKRSVTLFDKVIISVALDNYKNNLFDNNERINLLRAVTNGMEKVEVDSFKGLLVDYCSQKGATAIIRGLRAVSDFEYEFQMALMNKKLNNNVETIFLMTSSKFSFISSSIIKQASSLGGCVQGLVPDIVAHAITQKYS
ncbi:MAG: pantetheine-phosphate adenylyltransferase [Desulfitobacteriaceae bacterium]|nr:pantetheine-phosphate adenylyltransferase [Desulfitobacteriaceae bacterium]MDD4753661.1 pantetheine-phosphate adenylyltransferase [Desulfitobacteriaceae bacterium]